MATLDCYCHYIDPGFPGDPKCTLCEEKEKPKREARAAELAAAAAAQLALPDGHPERVFTDGQIRDVENGYCDSFRERKRSAAWQGQADDKRTGGRLLLRELRRCLGILK